MKNVVYSGIDNLPRGKASDHLTQGCLVLEGGAFRGVYTSGVLDALMEADINIASTIGVSAGAMNGMNYTAGQIGRSGRINLTYRHDPRYVGLKAIQANRGIIGFDFLMDGVETWEPFDWDAFNRPERRFVAVATNCLTGQTEYFEKGTGVDIRKAVQASASMPYVSEPVDVDGIPCLDGGCSVKIPLRWAMDQGFEKIVVVRTRPSGFRSKVKERSRHLAQRVYRGYPAFAEVLGGTAQRYNQLCGELELLRRSGRVFVISPSSHFTVSRLEKDMEKLGAFYYLGYNDGKDQLDALKAYLEA